MSQIRVLETVLSLLDEIGIPHMLVGSFASGFHGEFRATQDADVVIDPTPNQLGEFVDRAAAEFYVSREAALDALARFGRRQVGSLGELRVTINTAEDVVLSKLEWVKASGSERQMGDAAGVIEAWGERLDWEYLRRWAEKLSVSDLLDKARAEAGL
ncbi:MAG: hypothetical protein ACYCX3_07315 [Thermoleophilia bacterium]